MTMYPPPKCFECSKLKTVPRIIGSKGTCADYDKIPDSIFFQSGTCDKFESKTPIKKRSDKKILFCNIAWMKYYQGVTEGDIPRNGGKYVQENQFGNEAYNFMDYNHKCYGYVRPLGNLNLDKHFKDISSQETQVDDFTIIWCATNDTGGTRIVGWYENATVYREMQYIPSFTDEDSSLNFNFQANAVDCYLLPEEQRTFKIERAATAGKGNGFGQSNVWYAESAYAQNELIPKVLQYIEEYDGEFIDLTITDEIINAVITDENIKNDYAALFDKGMAYFNEDAPEYDMALKYFNTARKIEETPEVIFKIGCILFLYHSFDEAIPLFERCVELDFDIEDSMAYLIHAYDYSGNREKTLEYCIKLIDRLEKPGNKNDLDFRIVYSTTMCEIYTYFSDYKKATKIANKILTYADDEDAQEHVRNLLSYIKELQEEQEN